MKYDYDYDMTVFDHAREDALAAGGCDEQNLVIDGCAIYSWEAPEPGVDF